MAAFGKRISGEEVKIATPAFQAAAVIRDEVLSRIEPMVAVRIGKAELLALVNSIAGEIANEKRLLLNKGEQEVLANGIVDEMVGLGPIVPHLQAVTVSDILVNGPDMIYV